MLTTTDWRLEEAPALRGYAVEWVEPGFVLVSQGNRLYRSDTLAPPYHFIGEFPAPFPRRWASWWRLGQRLLRFMFYNVLKRPDGTLFLSFDKAVGVYADGRCRLLEGLVRPCRILRSGCALDRDGDVYFGEYVSNPDRGSVRVYRHAAGSSRLEIVHEFPPGTIRHVHGIHHDPYSDSLWCVTGDRPAECLVLRTFDKFNSFEVIGEGDETWRCINPIFTEDCVYYATDSEFHPNYVFRIDRGTGKRQKVVEIDGPVYYAARFGNDAIFAVTVELCPSQLGRSASLWHVPESGTATRILSFEKDVYSVKYFLPGTIHFPRGPGMGDTLYFNGVALRAADNRTFYITRKEHA